jgi:hypothetical protein
VDALPQARGELPQPRRRSGVLGTSLGPFPLARAIASTANLSQRHPATEKKDACTLEQDGVGRATDHIVIESAGLAHRPVLLFGRDMGGRSDSRGRRETRGELLFREDPPDFGCEQRQGRGPDTDPNRTRECGSTAFADQISQRLLGALRFADLACGVALLYPDVGEFMRTRSSTASDRRAVIASAGRRHSKSGN